MEVWKDISGYEGLYQVSNLGRVRSLNYNRTGEIRILKPIVNKFGYCVVWLCNESGRNNRQIHRIVADAFLDKVDKFCIVNHKNEIKTDNRVENLEWCTQKYNCNYGTGVERQVKNNPQCIRVIIDGKQFDSIKQAAEYFGEGFSSLSNAFRRGQTIFKGHKIERMKEYLS